MDPDYLAFCIPVAWVDEYYVNGEHATPTRIYLPGNSDAYFTRGGRRDTFGLVVRRGRFIEAVAALRGLGPEDVSLDERAIDLTPTAARHLHQCVAEMIRENPGDLTHRDFGEWLFALTTDVYLSARPEAGPRRRPARGAHRIVRKAEERFFAAEGGSVSLADLCAAANVSQGALYRAFRHVCGEPPLSYFHKRRLMRARSALLNSRPGRGAVKRAALDAGLTELGRFSVEYRRLFGQSPSATLARACE